jgi:hypothetical protein
VLAHAASSITTAHAAAPCAGLDTFITRFIAFSYISERRIHANLVLRAVRTSKKEQAACQLEISQTRARTEVQHAARRPRM